MRLHRNRKPRTTPTGCARCDGSGWVWLHGAAPDGTVRVVEASCPSCCGPDPVRVAEWRAAHHWSSHRAPCSHCGAWTNLRDDDGAPTHQVCAEHAEARAEGTGQGVV